MKAIIYAGIGLFSVATVYGIADYYDTQSTGIMDKMYKEEEPEVPAKKENALIAVLPVVNAITKTAETNIKTIAVKTNTRRTVKRSRTFELADFSRGRIRPPKVVDEDKTVEAVVVKEENK